MKKQLKRSNLGKINLITILYVTFLVTIAFYFIQSFHLYTFISRFADIAHRLNPKTLNGVAITSQLSLAKKTLKWLLPVNCHEPKNVKMAITSQLSPAKKR